MKKLKDTRAETLSAQKEAEKAFAKLEETRELLKLVEKEEIEEKETLTDKIRSLCDEKELFCGIILDADDLIALVKMMIEVKGPIKMEFKLYDK